MDEITLYDIRCLLGPEEFNEYMALISMARTGLPMSYNNYLRLEAWNKEIDWRYNETQFTLKEPEE